MPPCEPIRSIAQRHNCTPWHAGLLPLDMQTMLAFMLAFNMGVLARVGHEGEDANRENASNWRDGEADGCWRGGVLQSQE